MSAQPEPERRPRDVDYCFLCGRHLQVGDWPFCRGNPVDHVDPHYSFTWGEGGPFTRKNP